jgi:phospho-N-acetylmuramoyl-pentapeptide-transferase
MWPYLSSLLPAELVQHPTWRGALAAFTAFVLGVIFAPAFINGLKKRQFLDAPEKSDSQAVRDQNAYKKNTPTMGGIIILAAFLASLLLWADWRNPHVAWTMCAALGFSLIGFLDDVVKTHTKKKGLSARSKMALLLLLSLALSFAIWRSIRQEPTLTVLYLPFWRDFSVDLAVAGGTAFVALSVLVMSGSANAVNLTDGMDGLATGCTLITTAVFIPFAYAAGQRVWAQRLAVAYVPGGDEIAVCCFALFGACLAFLWYNSFPASVFMGDCGSLMLGGTLGYWAVVLRQEFLLFVAGGVFVWEAISVAIQVIHYKRTKRRVFLCAPVHHHYRLKGWPETKVVQRFWIIGILFALLALATFKLW